MWQNLKNSLNQLFYPAQCLHCRDFISPLDPVFCSICTSLLELINLEERCQICFEMHNDPVFHSCKHCQKNPSLFYRQAAAFDYIGPAASLIKKLKYGDRPHLAKGMAAFLVTQFLRLNWPFPDAIVPVPLSFSHWLNRGYNQSALIAQEMSHFLQVPFRDILKRKSGDFSQAGLTLNRRLLLQDHSFKLKKNSSLGHQTILLIDDVVTSGATLNRCAQCLMEGNPASLYSLTFCKTLINI